MGNNTRSKEKAICKLYTKLYTTDMSRHQLYWPKPMFLNQYVFLNNKESDISKNPFEPVQPILRVSCNLSRAKFMASPCVRCQLRFLRACIVTRSALVRSYVQVRAQVSSHVLAIARHTPTVLVDASITPIINFNGKSV